MAPHLARDAVILSLQNGVDNPERIGLHAGNEVIPVLVYAGANIPAPGSVRHTGGGNIVIGRLAKFRGGAESGPPSARRDRGIVRECRRLGENLRRHRGRSLDQAR